VYAISLLALLLMPPQTSTISHTVPIDAEHTLVLIGGRLMSYPAMGEYGTNLISVNSGERLKLAIAEKSGAMWELGDASINIGELYGRIARVDNRSAVVQRSVSDYGIAHTSLKFFFDLAARKLLKVVEFDPRASVVRIQPSENGVCAHVRTGETAFTSCGDEHTQVITAQMGPADNLPELRHPLLDAASPIPEPLPQSTYDHFARARPDRVRDGYTREGTEIDERVGAHQPVGDRIWFGKAFYDGEGTTGVGDIGYFDVRTRRFTMMSVPELAAWSVSALLVETDAVWAGAVTFPEGAERSGGLIRYELSTRTVTRYNIPDIPITMFRKDNTLCIGTSNGLYFLRDGRLTRWRFEPNLEGKIEPVHDSIP